MTPPSHGRRIGEAQHPEADLGAYLLAALAPAEEAALEAHLQRCASCQDRLVELSEVLPALAQAPVDSAVALVDSAAARPEPAAAVAVPSAAVPSVARALARSGARWRVAAAAGGVAAAAAAAILVAVAIGDRGESGGQALGPTTSVAPVSLVRVFPYTDEDSVTVRAWNSTDGANVTVQCSNDRTAPPVPDPDRPTYELWALRRDGAEYKVSSWQTVYGEDTFPGRLDFPVDQIKAFELRTASGRVLSTVFP